MGDQPDWTSLRQRLTGKWQIPALVVSIALLAIAFRTLRPSPVELDLKQAADYLATLVSGGMYDRALQDGTLLLGRKQDTEADRAPIYLQVARARYGEAERRGVRTAAVGHRIAQDYQHAVENGIALAPQDLVQLAHVQEWQSRFSEAVALYERAVEKGVPDPLALRRRVIELLRDHELVDAEALGKRIASFLNDAPAHRLDLRLWAIEEGLYALEAQGRLAEGATLLARYADAFRGSDLENRFSFLEALLLYKSGYYDEAEIRARTIMNRAHRQDAAYAMAGWLLGRVVMYDDGPKRPEEALAFFDDVTGIAPNTPYGVASFVGKAEALALLERPDDALDAYRVALQLVPTLHDKRVVNYAVLRSSLGAASERARQGGDRRTALAFSRMAASIIDRSDVELSTLILEQLAANQTRLAEELTEQSGDMDTPDRAGAPALMKEARGLFAAAADTYTDIAQLNALNERKAASASWRAAESAMRAGASRRAARMFEMYIQERPRDSLVPRALLRIGQLRKRAGDLDAAIKAFQECYRRYPRTLDGARALVPLAESYLAKTPPDAELAEKTLRIIVEQSEVFTPDAPEFSDALFLMGEAQSLSGDPERAIATFEEVIARYPNDPRVRRGRY